MEPNSKLMVKVEEAAIKDAAWNNEYVSFIAAIDELKAEALKIYEECLSNRVSQILAYISNPPMNGSS